MNAGWKKKLKGDPVPWLLKSNPWTKYRTLTDLLNTPPSSAEVKGAKNELLNDPQVKTLLTEALQWFPQSITRHNDAKLSHYKLMVLAELGLTIKDKGMRGIANKASKHLEDGMFAIRETLPEKGMFKPDLHADEWHALPCDSPIVTYSLLLSGLDNSIVRKSVEKLKEKWKTNQGWFCHFFFVESQFRKFQAGCPMAGLMALEVFSQVPNLKESVYARNAFEPIKFHGELGKSLYYFGRSKKFWTLKYPFIWYNALYLADVLARFDFLKGDKLVKELIKWIEQSQDGQGRFKPNSVWMAYKGWDFADKKEPSPWVTFLCCRILKRWYE